MTPAITILSTKKLKPGIISSAEQSGIQIIDEDFISIRYLDDDKPVEKLQELKEHLVFTSSNAVKGFLHQLDNTWYSLPPKKVFCLVGETQKALEGLSGVKIVATASYGAELAERITEQKNIKAVSFICGSRRRDVLPNLLKAQKIKLAEWVVYETVLTGKLIRESYQGVLFFSPSGAESYFQTNVIPKGVTCFCIGETTADAVKGFTSNNIVVADNVTQESIMKAVGNWFHSQLRMNSK